METDVAITRTVELDLAPDELWEMIGNGDRWADWMVDTATLDVAPGGTGLVTDGDEDREVRIERVDEGERISFQWWPVGQPDQSSSVDLVILPARHGTVLEIVETFPAGTTLSAAWRRPPGLHAFTSSGQCGGCSSPRERSPARRLVRRAGRSDPPTAARTPRPRRSAHRHPTRQRVGGQPTSDRQAPAGADVGRPRRLRASGPGGPLPSDH